MGNGAGRETHLPGPSGLCTPVRTPQGGGGQDSALPRGTCGPDVCVGDSKAKGLGCSPGFKGPPRRLGPAGQSRKAAPGHRKRRIQPASPRHATGTTLRGSGRGRRAGGMRRGHALAWGKRDGEGSGNHRTCPSPELGPRGQTYPCSHRPFTPAGDRAPGTASLRPQARYKGLAGASWPLAADELIFHPLE